MGAIGSTGPRGEEFNVAFTIANYNAEITSINYRKADLEAEKKQSLNNADITIDIELAALQRKLADLQARRLFCWKRCNENIR
ncbi:MAG: hypothetical protein Sylvanvirus33_5 [Sylvanvirus sp.]|uniref:Uncharacterized protein n=1 Tax=Sylvanvirus sp. TaxID=2487774 RepID=A0A3G5AMD9_9VIRU|nr:MAG: hypothetical protein Sylvanvirus33_5 [Sylvanvirus sp.]